MKNRKEKMLKGIMTIEMTYIMSVILFVFFLCVLGLLYYHDKEIMSACAYEAVTVASTKAREKEPADEALVKEIFEERIRGKMILFVSASPEASVEKEKIHLGVRSGKRTMRLSVVETAGITDPEKRIRDRRRLWK